MSPFSLLAATMFLLTPLSLLYQQRADKKHARKDVSHLFLEGLRNRVAPVAAPQRGKSTFMRSQILANPLPEIL